MGALCRFVWDLRTIPIAGKCHLASFHAALDLLNANLYVVPKPSNILSIAAQRRSMFGP